VDVLANQLGVSDSITVEQYAEAYRRATTIGGASSK